MKDEVIRDLKEQTDEVIRDLRSTADVLEAIQHGEAPGIQGRNPGGDWRQIPVARADDWHFLRFTPPQHQVDTAKLKADWEAAGCPSWVIEFRKPGSVDWRTVPALSCGWCELYEHRRQLEPTPEQLRIEANKKLRKEWEKPESEGGGFALQFLNHHYPEEGWRESIRPSWSAPNLDAPNLEYRRKPDPQPVPWSFADRIVGKVVVRKSDGTEVLILGRDKSTQCVATIWGSVTYDALRIGYEQLDGTPCGRMPE